MSAPDKLYATTDFKIQTTVLPWHLKNWDFITRRPDKKVFKIGEFSPANHSCRFDFSFSIDDYDEAAKCYKSWLEVKLHHGQGLGSKFLINAYLQKDDKTQYTGGTQCVGPIGQDFRLLKFAFPALKSVTSSNQGILPALKSYVKDNALVIYIRIEEFIELHGIVNDSIEEDDKSMFQSETVTELYKSQELVDITFIIGPNKQTLLAHSVILAAACPYFLTMFTTSEMKEQKTHVVDLTADTDVTFEIFQGFLDYVYGVKSVDQISDMAKGLVILADKYNYQRLRRDCERVLCDTLDKDNVAALLVLAHQYDFQLLKRKALTLATSCEISIKEFSGFRDMCQYPNLMGDLMASLSI